MPKKKQDRVDIPEGIAARVQFLSDRTCCVCRVPDKAILHHIDEDNSTYNIDNQVLAGSSLLGISAYSRQKGSFASITFPVVFGSVLSLLLPPWTR
jgi:hypothetical protein